MRILMVALAATVLAGCAGSVMDDSRTKAPYKVLTSDKPEKVVAQCVQFGWQDEAVLMEGVAKVKTQDFALPDSQ